MKTHPELEDLIAAAQRTEADKKRQQELSALIDQWESAEKPSGAKRRVLWTATGVAASIILIVSIGVRLLSNSDIPQPGPVMAETQPVRPIALPTDTTRHHTTVSPRKATFAARPVVNSSHSDALLAENTSTDAEPILSIDATIHDEPALIAGSGDTIASPMADITTTETRIYQRASNRLVGNTKQQTGSRNRTNDDTPQLAFINCSGTSATIEIGSIKF